MGGYLLFACGLINLRYQWGSDAIIAHSALIFVPGATAIALTFIPAAIPVLTSRIGKAFSIVIGLALIIFALKN